ncbi:toxin-activating lysine-acyltransferase [Thalassococcus sp. CAU 1522]|uniref:RTX toxin-activating lysine-acyltransferase n=1 Tax=Thalassococcus arenae TaxID=2851652 RepID=A0ABS6N9X8_9RHOB|nr:toxin-activating lysine-acyltransferase [Thalassococcus arenae]MBV2360783.1 toxin-activating lysine-acyltransferase [Thalassococcus arenae]
MDKTNAGIDPDVLDKIAAVRNQVRENFGKVALAMMALPRYRHNTLADLNHLILEPMLRDRIAIAQQVDADDNPMADLAGIAIWASVSEEVDRKIREQIKAAVFPVRLKADEWTSGKINWLLDVIAPDQKSTARVIAGFGQVAKQGELRLHPIIPRLVDEQTLQKLGARSRKEEDG